MRIRLKQIIQGITLEAHREAERLRQFSRDNTHFGRVFLYARLQLGQRIPRTPY